MRLENWLAALAIAAIAGVASGSGVAAADTDPGLPGPEAPVAPVAPGPQAPVAPQTDLPVPADPFATTSQQTKSNPVGALADLLSGSGGSPAAILGQGVGLNGAPQADPLASVGALLPQNYRMPSGEDDSPYVLQTGVPAGPFARVDAFKGVHALLHGSLGRMPGAELGQPLPGTAPPPGTAIPAGIEQFITDPPLPVEPGVPPVPPS